LNVIWSVQALESERSELTLEEYKLLGQKISPMYGDDRDTIYELYGLYKEKKGELNVFDKMDVVHHIYRQLKAQGGYKGVPIHNVFVDEVQDLTQAELHLFFVVRARPSFATLRRRC
jgi:superfamily I DNA/RNA helicase